MVIAESFYKPEARPMLSRNHFYSLDSTYTSEFLESSRNDEIMINEPPIPADIKKDRNGLRPPIVRQSYRF
jgi:hypothetical protein